MDNAPSIETAVLENSKLTDDQIEAFQDFIDHLNECNSDQEKIKVVEKFSLQIAEKINPNIYEEPCETDYARNYLFKDDSGWEVLLICWEKRNKTTVHGHPSKCCYNFISGDFKIDFYKKVSDTEVKKVSSNIAQNLNAYSYVGEKYTYDNHIHQIECLSDRGFSINIYSEDARLGQEFEIIN